MKRISVGVIVLSLFTANLYGALGDFSFDRVTASSSVDISGQLKLNVSSGGQEWDETYKQNVNKVTFKFSNIAGGIDAVISEIYFYDGVLLNMYSIDDSYPGVNFEGIGMDTNPSALSGYKPSSTLVGVLGATEAVNPEPLNGVKVGGWIKIGYTLLPDKTFQDLLDDMASGEVVVGVHVKSIEQPEGNSPSDSFISTVPEPATLSILGLGSVLLLRRRRI
ncbi:MAG: PEP-CTERM sorting domain-containing protein [Planctomycetota bacterium]|jgi:hypothetical protein